METSILKIGNSKDLRLSKSILEKYNISEKVEIILEKGRIILKPIENPRKNWEKAFQKIHVENDDQLLVNDTFDNETLEEWK
jgi:antitoxin MazE